LSIASRNAGARIRESIYSGRAVSGLIAGALFGILAKELELGAFLAMEVSMQDVLVLAIVSAIGSSFRGFLRYLWIADVALLCLAWTIAFTPVISRPTQRWVRDDSLPSGGVQAVVVLSSSVTSGGTLGGSGSDRLLAGLELIRRGVAPRLVTTRVTCCGDVPEVSSDADQRRLIVLAGVADRWILVGDHVTNTHDEAIAIHRRLGPLGVRSIALVTSPMHTRRACATFERDGTSVTCVPALERGEQTYSPREFSDRLAAFRAYLHERLGWWVYRRRGWVNDG
jgi:uncharacterized SAM-binding protein YcdF (DUF218 family)